MTRLNCVNISCFFFGIYMLYLKLYIQAPLAGFE